jgi:hypothetical protein
MKTILLLFLASAVISSAQDWERAGGSFGVVRPNIAPVQQSPQEIAQRNYNSRLGIADGKVIRLLAGKKYNVVETPAFERIQGEVYEKSGNVIILLMNYYVGSRNTYYIAITNYPSDVIIQKQLLFLAARAGTFNWADSQPIALYDYGIPYVPTPEEIAAAKAAQEKAKAEQKAKTDARIAAGKAAALKANQDAAAKGDSLGLLRMGERYRDGDGVEKDLAKAKDYLQRAADAGSPTAADELKNLSQ